MALFKADLEELKLKFKSLNTKRDIADLLEIEYSSLIYYLYKAPRDKEYTRFLIPKRAGGTREIYAPVSTLKFIQKKLNYVLQNVYKPKICVFGFIKTKNIVHNAKVHSGQKYVLNIDLENFFPSINFGRVRAIFKTYPFHFNSTVATALAQLSCFNNHLPQGAPTSPIISNLICARLDSELLNFARKYNCRYSRYADDLTFSTSLSGFPFAIAELEPDASKKRIDIGNELKQIIYENGFKIHYKKGGLRNFRQRQTVTGLTANKFPNVNREFIRQIRAMLHDWEINGLETAAENHFTHFNYKYRNPDKKSYSFKEIVIGKINFIGMVRGRANKIYKKFYGKIKDLDPSIKMRVEFEDKPLIYTEGASDWKHLKAALKKLRMKGHFLDLDIEFCEFESFLGDGELLKLCREKRLTTQPRILIFVFDRDKPKTINSVTTTYRKFKHWGNNVYSFALPVPLHRKNENFQALTIELYYKDEEIKRMDSFGRRLFLNNEFDKDSGKHMNENCQCREIERLKNPNLCIIDDEVFNKDNKNIALSKNNFARNIINGVENFNDFDFSEFKGIFTIIKEIKSYSEKH